MSLRWTAAATNGNINCGSDTSLDDVPAGTYWLWVYLEANGATNKVFISKGTTGRRTLAFDTATTMLFEADRVTLDLSITCDVANFAVYGLNKWLFLGCSFDIAGADGDQLLFMGDLETMAAEPSAYTLRRAGTGSLVTNASDSLIVGNLPANNRCIQGYIDSAGFVNRRMPLAELQQFQFASFPERNIDGSVLVLDLGAYGTIADQPDQSGTGNDGTGSGANLSVATVQPPRRRLGGVRGWRGYQVAASGGGPPPATLPRRGYPRGLTRGLR